jgi:hypothetical protein
MFANCSTKTSRLLLRHFSGNGHRKPFNNHSSKVKSYNQPTSPSPWDHVYGLSSVVSALHSKKRSVLDTVYILESDEKKTTQKKDASLLDNILQLTKAANIYTVAVDKGRLNNLTDNKTHQVKK